MNYSSVSLLELFLILLRQKDVFVNCFPASISMGQPIYRISIIIYRQGRLERRNVLKTASCEVER